MQLKHNRPMCLDYDEKCGWCRNDMTHTCYEHDKAVAETNRKTCEREDALYRQARHQYNNP